MMTDNVGVLRKPSFPGPQIIKHTPFNERLASIDECHELSIRSGERKCMLLQGETGVGKTTLVQYYQQQFTAKHKADDLTTPVLYVTVPSPVTVKALVARMLSVLGVRVSSHRTLYSQSERLVHYLDTCGVQMVILDEFQHLILHSGRSQLEVSDFLKNLIKESQIFFLLVGLDDTSSQTGTQLAELLKSNPQLSRLFARRELLEPFDTENKKEFSAFLEEACKVHGVNVVGMSKELFRARTLACTGGVTAHIIELLIGAQIEAEKSGSNLVSAEHLSRAFNKEIRHTNGKDDPFARRS